MTTKIIYTLKVQIVLEIDQVDLLRDLLESISEIGEYDIEGVELEK